MVRNHFNYNETANRRFERSSSFSLTVPDQSIPLRKLIDRHLNGGQVAMYRPEYLGPDTDIPDGFERMSSIERAQMLKSTAEFIADSRGRLMTSRAAAAKAAAEAKIIAEYKAKQAAKAAASAEDVSVQ